MFFLPDPNILFTFPDSSTIVAIGEPELPHLKIKTMKRSLIALVFPLAIMSLFYSCKKDDVATGEPAVPAGMNHLKIMLTDDPSPLFDSIFIDIQMVEV